MTRNLNKALLVFFWGVFCACTSKEPAKRMVQYSQPEGHVKIISYNIRQSGLAANDGPNAWTFRKDATLNMIEQEAPSVLGFQELLPDQQSYIRSAFPQYGFVGVGRDDGKELGECMGILYFESAFNLVSSGTFWLSSTPDSVSKGWDAACFRTATWILLEEKASGKQFFYLNTHLDHVGTTAREESIKLIVSRISVLAPDDCPIIIGGDLNSGIDSPIFEPFENIGLVPAREISPETDRSGTFNAFGSAPSGIVLDHIYERGVNPLCFHTLQNDYGVPFISDHYPISFTFEL